MSLKEKTEGQPEIAVWKGPYEEQAAPALEIRFTRPPESLWRDAWRRLLRNRAAVAGGIFIIVLVLMAIFYPSFISPYPHDEANFDEVRQPPSWQHIMGTDKQGRDILVRIIWGARVSVGIGILGALVILIIGVIFGAISGYVGGWVDNIMMRMVDVVYAFPALLFIILLMVVLGTSGGALMVSIRNIVIGVCAVTWMNMARLVRGQFLSLREKEFVEAARMIGVGHVGIIARHLLPNSLGPVIVALTLTIPQLILTEAVLSFIGLGIQPPDPSWGTMLNDSWRAMRTNWWLVFFPGLALSVTMLAFNFLGDGLRDALDPRMRGQI